MAILRSSHAPLLLLDRDLIAVRASASFCRDFHLQPNEIEGQKLSDLGNRQWNDARLLSLLDATVHGKANFEAFEFDLAQPDGPPLRLVLNAHRLDYSDANTVRVILAATDVTAARVADELKNSRVREKQALLQELQHRVANSLHVVGSVLMESAEVVECQETRAHLHSAYKRVMSIAALQRELAAVHLGDVDLKTYLADLCQKIGDSMIDDHDRFAIYSTVDDSFVESEVSASLGLIVTELVLNSLKHAFPGFGMGRIEVAYQSDGAAWDLSVTDDGIGMPTRLASDDPGLGNGIVRALSRKLDAKVTVSDAIPGTRVDVRHSPRPVIVRRP
jgi:two-component sensor histidine kinase